MSQINQVPTGLQGALNSKNFGKNPSELAQTVIPTVDLQPFWDATRLRTLYEQDAAVTAANTSLSIVVPNNEIWRIYTVGSYAFDVADAELFRISIDFLSGRDINEPALVGMYGKNVSAGNNINTPGAVLAFPQGILLPPDSRVRVVCRDLSAAATIGMNVSVSYAQYPY